MNKRAYLPDFSEEFKINNSTRAFLDEYDLWTDVKVVREDEYGDEYAVLNPEVQKELAKTMTTFYELNTHDELDDTAKAIEEEVLKELKKISPDVECSWGENSRLGYIYMQVDVYMRDENGDLFSETFEPSGLYYNDGETMYDAAKNWNWAAWLGIDDSPFYDRAWERAYLLDDANRYFGEVELHEINVMEDWVLDQIEDMEDSQ